MDTGSILHRSFPGVWQRNLGPIGPLRGALAPSDIVTLSEDSIAVGAAAATRDSTIPATGAAIEAAALNPQRNLQCC